MNLRHTLAISLLLSSSLTVQGQFIHDWSDSYQHTSANNFSNENRKIATDNTNGFVYMLNDVTSNIDLSGNVTANTYSYSVLLKYDKFGTLLKEVPVDVGQHVATGFDRKSSFGLCVLQSTGDVFVGYQSYNSTTSYDINITKYDSQTNVDWTYTYNAVTEDYGYELAISNYGNAFAVIRSVAPTGTIRHRILKATGAGTSAVAHYTYSTQPDYPVSLAVDPNLERVYLTGHRLVGTVKNILVSCVAGNMSMGTLLWSRVNNCGTVTGDDFARKIIIGYDGFLYLTGSSTGPVSHGIDVVTMKYNPTTGKLFWENYINLNLTDGGFFVLNPDNDYAFVAWSAGNTVYIDQIIATSGTPSRRLSYIPTPASPYNSIGGVTITDLEMSSSKRLYMTGTVTASNSGQDFCAAYLVRESFNARSYAHVEYALTVDGDASESLRATEIALLESDDKIYLACDQISTYASHLMEGALVQGFSCTGNLREQGTSNDEMESLPYVIQNPFSQNLVLYSDQFVDRTEVYDYTGRIIYESDLDWNNENPIDASAWTNGTYMIRFIHSDGTASVKNAVKTGIEKQ